MNKNKRLNARVYHAKEGEILYSVATGHINSFRKASREAVRVMCEQQGYVACHPCNQGTLWFYDSLNNAKGARNIASKIHGIQCGENICKFVYRNGTFEFSKD